MVGGLGVEVDVRSCLPLNTRHDYKKMMGCSIALAACQVVDKKLIICQAAAELFLVCQSSPQLQHRQPP